MVLRVRTPGGQVVVFCAQDAPAGRSICVRHRAFLGPFSNVNVPGAEVSINKAGVIVVVSIALIEDGDGLSSMRQLVVTVAHKDGVCVV